MHTEYTTSPLKHTCYQFIQPAPCVLRAAAVKAELSDTEGLRYKVEEKNQDIVELKKTIKIKVCS